LHRLLPGLRILPETLPASVRPSDSWCDRLSGDSPLSAGAARRLASPCPSPHEVMLAIHIHEQILLEILKQTRRWGTKAVVIPLEAPGWISPAARREAARICRENGVEVSFPKPFCTLDPLPGSWLARFRDEFHLGRPKGRSNRRGRSDREGFGSGLRALRLHLLYRAVAGWPPNER
jgi:hypothetical protein